MTHDNVTDIVERLQLAATDAIHDDAKAAILEAIQIICNQEADNFALAAGSCDVEGGKIGDEHGHFYCTLQADLATLRKQLENARSEALEEAAKVAESMFQNAGHDGAFSRCVNSVAQSIRALKGQPC